MFNVNESIRSDQRHRLFFFFTFYKNKFMKLKHKCQDKYLDNYYKKIGERGTIRGLVLGHTEK